MSLPVVQEFEGRAGCIPMEKNLRDIRDALKDLGVEFQTVTDGLASVVFKDKDAFVAPQSEVEGGK